MSITLSRSAASRSFAVDPAAGARGRCAMSRCQVWVNLASRIAAAPLSAALVVEQGRGGAVAEEGKARAGEGAGVAEVLVVVSEGREVQAEVGRVVLAGGSASRRRRCT